MAGFRRARYGGFPGRLVAGASIISTLMIAGFCSLVSIASDEAPAFKPEDISIGEPISLPSAAPLASPAPERPSMPPALRATGPQPASATHLPSVIAPAAPLAGDRRQTMPTSPPDSPMAGDSSADFAAAGTGWLGIAVDDSLVTGRLVVVEVAPDGPAARAGVRPQDMLLAIDGNHLQTGDELAAALAAIAPGQTVRMAIGRDNSVEEISAHALARPPKALSRDWHSSAAGQTTPGHVAPPASAPFPAVTLPEAATSVPSKPAAEVAAAALLPAPLPTAPTTAPPASGRTALGVRTVPVDPNTQSRFRLPEPAGALVIGVVQDLPASRAGVPPGSVIVAINHQPVRSPRDLTQLVSSGPVGTPVPLHYVLPGGQSRQADVVLQSLEQPLARALVGDDDAAPMLEPPSLRQTPQTRRRVDLTAASEPEQPATVARLEDLLHRINNRLQQIERRLERLDQAR